MSQNLSWVLGILSQRQGKWLRSSHSYLYSASLTQFTENCSTSKQISSRELTGECMQEGSNNLVVSLPGTAAVRVQVLRSHHFNQHLLSLSGSVIGEKYNKRRFSLLKSSQSCSTLHSKRPQSDSDMVCSARPLTEVPHGQHLLPWGNFYPLWIEYGD